MRTIFLIAVLSAMASGREPVVGAEQRSTVHVTSERQLLEQRRDLLRHAAKSIPPSNQWSEGLEGSELYTFTYLNWVAADLELATDQRRKLELYNERLEALLSSEKKIRALHDVGARGGERWRVLRSECRALRGKIAVLRESAPGSDASSAISNQMAELHKQWLKTARDYAAVMWEAIGQGYDTPQLMLPALAELQDAEFAIAKSSQERIAAQARHVAALRNVESALQNPEQKFAGNRRLTELATRTLRIEAEVRLTKDKLACGRRPCAAATSALELLKRERLHVRAEHLAAMQAGLWERNVWMEALLEGYRGTCDAELDLCRSSRERQATLAKWIDRLATLQAESEKREISPLCELWHAECAAERLRLIVEFNRLQARSAI